MSHFEDFEHQFQVIVGDYISNIWVMWTIRTFTNPWSSHQSSIIQFCRQISAMSHSILGGSSHKGTHSHPFALRSSNMACWKMRTPNKVRWFSLETQMFRSWISQLATMKLDGTSMGFFMKSSHGETPMGLESLELCSYCWLLKGFFPLVNCWNLYFSYVMLLILLLKASCSCSLTLGLINWCRNLLLCCWTCTPLLFWSPIKEGTRSCSTIHVVGKLSYFTNQN